MSTISFRIPDSLHSMTKRVAKLEHTSINQFINSALAEKLSALETEEYLVDYKIKTGKIIFLFHAIFSNYVLSIFNEKGQLPAITKKRKEPYCT